MYALNIIFCIHKSFKPGRKMDSYWEKWCLKAHGMTGRREKTKKLD